MDKLAGASKQPKFLKIPSQNDAEQQIAQIREQFGSNFVANMLGMSRSRMTRGVYSIPVRRLAHLNWCLLYRPDLLSSVFDVVTLARYNPTFKTRAGKLRQQPPTPQEIQDEQMADTPIACGSPSIVVSEPNDNQPAQ